MKEALFYNLLIFAFLAMVSIRIYFGNKDRQNREGVEFEEIKPNPVFQAISSLGYVGSMVVYIFFPSLINCSAILIPGVVRWIGAFLTISSVLLLWWIKWASDVQFDGTLHSQAKHKLIRHGQFRQVRHPMYTVLFLMSLGWFLLTANWLVGIPLMIEIVMVVISRFKNEEDLLIELFGDEYRDYRQHSSRFIPFLFVGK